MARWGRAGLCFPRPFGRQRLPRPTTLHDGWSEGFTDPDTWEYSNERAAIAVYDDGRSRTEAEAFAVVLTRRAIVHRFVCHNRDVTTTAAKTTSNESQQRGSTRACPHSEGTSKPAQAAIARAYEAGQDPCSDHRRRRDSNPRNVCTFNGFQDRRLQPLGHSSNTRGERRLLLLCTSSAKSGGTAPIDSYYSSIGLHHKAAWSNCRHRVFSYSKAAWVAPVCAPARQSVNPWI